MGPKNSKILMISCDVSPPPPPPTLLVATTTTTTTTTSQFQSYPPPLRHPLQPIGILFLGTTAANRFKIIISTATTTTTVADLIRSYSKLLWVLIGAHHPRPSLLV